MEIKKNLKRTSLRGRLELLFFDYYCAGYGLGRRAFISAGPTNFLILTGSVAVLVPPKPLIQWML